MSYPPCYLNKCIDIVIQSGASEIKYHPFFKSINFALLRHLEPPILSLINSPDDKDQVMAPEPSSDPQDKIQSYNYSPFENFNSITLHRDNDSYY
ncbi:hypothetical protein BCR42DRAFT_433953 [Absidia repens]|uniref:AGC-kinase C-terminal domain-containing protein n=1 Tax=Absidia repens TaxID=90262 RepID=A0A1X2IV18_9FUNG|nr:hypothetical protein BCR42DRAFT_433953 [Absidia repens]